MKIIIAALACLLATSTFAASEYVTYKTGSNRYGAIAWQIDITTIRQEGRYRTFWNHIWEYGLKQPTTFSDNEQLGFLSQKFAVDCVHQRFGPHFIDSNWPAERHHRARIETMRWVPLGKVMARTGMRREIILAALLLATAAQAQDLGKAKLGDAVGTESVTPPPPVPVGEGNLPPGFYPRSPCEKPDKKALGSLPEASNQAAMEGYNGKVKAFNQKAVAFNACIKAYVDRAQNDIKAIQDMVHAAVTDANAH